MSRKRSNFVACRASARESSARRRGSAANDDLRKWRTRQREDTTNIRRDRTVMRRRKLTRKSKDMTIMRQFGKCGYCGDVMTDSAQTDHMDENCTNDSPENLIACCCNCHGDKTQHYRKGRIRQLNAMLHIGRLNKQRWQKEWCEMDDHYHKLPDWLRDRVTQDKVSMYASRVRASMHAAPMDIEQFRYHPARQGKTPAHRPTLR